MKLMFNFFSEKALRYVPENLISLMSNNDYHEFGEHIRWESRFPKLVFQSKLRLEEYRKQCIKIALETNDIGRIFEAYHVSEHPFDINLGKPPIPLIPWMNEHFLSQVPTVMFYGVGYDEEKLYLSLSVPFSYPNINVSYTIIKRNYMTCEDVAHLIMYDVVDGEVDSFCHYTIDCTIKSVIVDDQYVVTLAMPRHWDIRHSVDGRSEYLVFFEVNYHNKLLGINGVCLHGNYTSIPRYIVIEDS